MKNRLIQVALSLALLGLLIQIVLIAPSQIRDNESKAALLPTPDVNAQPPGPPGNDVDQSINGMHTIETQEGRKEWELWSKKATSLKTKEMLDLETVKIVFFSDSGVTFTVTGDRGVVQTKKILRVEGNVITRSSNGYVFRTASMEYISETRQLTAPGHVEMWGPPDAKGHTLHLTGMGMRASVTKSIMEILNDVHAEKGLDDNRQALIRSHRSIFSGKDKTARFMDDVVLDIDSMRITGPEATFNYDGKSDMVKSVYITGGTKVSDTDKWATSQNLSIDFESNRYTFRGNPRVVQNNDELRGEEIVFLEGGKQVQVQRARAKVDEKHMEKSPEKKP
jgi:LPS export ABC transporter protein LptC